MDVYKWATEAYPLIKPYVRETPLEYSPHLSALCRAKVYLKLENQQVTGSFKARGALNKVLGLSAAEKERGIVTASTGNHAAAVGFALAVDGAAGEIYMPENVARLKVDNLRQYKNVTIKLHGRDPVEAEAAAKQRAADRGCVYISPYNDAMVIGGQGTVAVEILHQLPDVDEVLVPVGGGGLVSGIAGYLAKARPQARVIGCQPQNSAVMYHSVKAGKILDMPSLPTISDGTAGGIEPGAITFSICRQNVDDYLLLTEEEILSALGILLKHHQLMAEGAAGLSVAALLKDTKAWRGKNVVLIICGNKMSIDLCHRALATLAG